MILPVTLQQFLVANLALAPISKHPAKDLPACSIFSAHPCSCPSGTELITSTVYAPMGANAYAIKEIVENFFDLSWVGIPIKKTQGCKNELGAVRFFDITTQQGVNEWHEELVKKQSRFDGSFLFQYQVKNVPIEYPSKNGSFGFDSFTFKSEAISWVQTNVSWHMRACHTRAPHTNGGLGIPEFQTAKLGEMQKKLREAGHTEGSYIEPWFEIGNSVNVTSWVNSLDPALGAWDEPEGLESEACGSY